VLSVEQCFSSSSALSNSWARDIDEFLIILFLISGLRHYMKICTMMKLTVAIAIFSPSVILALAY
jgi:hypothetical protein